MVKNSRPATVKKPSDETAVPFSFHPRVFAALGADLVTNDLVAVIELVKNCYDAFATRVDVRFKTGDDGEMCLEIEDNGVGMSDTVIRNVWCVVATPFRNKNITSTLGEKKRRVSGAKGLGHYVAGHPDLAAARALYCDILGLRISDYIFIPNPDGSVLRAMFLHANARHHSVAFVETELPQNIDHFFLQMQEFEDMGRTYDRFIESPYAIRNSLGQHPNDHGDGQEHLWAAQEADHGAPAGRVEVVRG